MLAGAARGETGCKGWGGLVRLSDVDTWELAVFQNELIPHFMLAADVVRSGIWEFMNNADGPAFLERELVGLRTGRSEFVTVQVERCPLTRLESI